MRSETTRILRRVEQVLSEASGGAAVEPAVVAAAVRLIEQELARERTRCAEICRRRGELWRRTEERTPLIPAREEARWRSNEARYLADLLESDESFVEPDA